MELYVSLKSVHTMWVTPVESMNALSSFSSLTPSEAFLFCPKVSTPEAGAGSMAMKAVVRRVSIASVHKRLPEDRIWSPIGKYCPLYIKMYSGILSHICR
jgi:hypothetical protein